jgi:tetratricopeptide (TPR) repeat protein
MGNCWTWLCCGSKTAEDTPGDKAFDDGDSAYGKFKESDASQRNSPESQALLKNAIKLYDTAADYYRRTSDPNLGAVLVNLATVKWDVYRFVKETDENDAARSENLLEEVIKLDDEALRLWQAREHKPDQYPTLLANLAEAYRERFVKNKQSKDVQKAIQLYEDARDHIDTATKPHVEVVKELGITHWMSYKTESVGDQVQLESAIQCLKDANNLAQNKYRDIQHSCWYTLAWINHHRFNKQEEQIPPPPNPNKQYLNDAIDFYQSTLQGGMPQNDPRYSKALQFVPMLLFHRYERDKKVDDLKAAQRWARDAVNFPRITDEDVRKQLRTVLDIDSKASSKETRDASRAIRKTTMNSFRSSSDDYLTMPSATATMPTVSEAGDAASHFAGEDGQEKYTDRFGIPGGGAVTEEPSPLTTLHP